MTPHGAQNHHDNVNSLYTRVFARCNTVPESRTSPSWVLPEMHEYNFSWDRKALDPYSICLSHIGRGSRVSVCSGPPGAELRILNGPLSFVDLITGPPKRRANHAATISRGHLEEIAQKQLPRLRVPYLCVVCGNDYARSSRAFPMPSYGTGYRRIWYDASKGR